MSRSSRSSHRGAPTAVHPGDAPPAPAGPAPSAVPGPRVRRGRGGVGGALVVGPAAAALVALGALAVGATSAGAASTGGTSAGAATAGGAAPGGASTGSTGAGGRPGGRTVVLRASPAPAAPAVAAPAAAPARPRIVGGTTTTIASAPWQVRIRARDDGQPYGAPGAFSYGACGGAVIDATHVVTAAHCVLNGRVDRPAVSFRVNSGFSRFNAAPGSGGEPMPLASDTPQTRTVSAVRRHPGYVLRDGSSGTIADLADDVAVLTLSTPLTFDANTQPIALADVGPSPVGPARITGFGLQSDGGAADGLLHALDVPLIDAATPLSAGGAGGVNALYAVSRTPAGSTCQGDSGGPLVQAGRLVGVVSSGPACGGGQPSFYTNVAAPEVREFVLGSDAPPAAPRGGEDVSLRTPRAPRTGDALTCSAGTWSNAPAFVHVFTDTRTGRVLQSGPSPTHVLAPDTVGATVSCRAIATTAGGAGRTPSTTATAAVAQGPQARLRASVSISRSRVRRSGLVTVRVRVRNVGDAPAAGVRTCVRPGPRFLVRRTGGGTLVGGRVCFTNTSISRSTTKRLVLKVRRRAARGRTTVASVSATAPTLRSASASRRVTVRR
ncbi:unannotated protein [freshwater metagenome]|uniref:Unannotated protein n=1 Tax=freshwater metagenome TaxID=449393 RepID=A0A6J7G545_9ZZZZ|nr:trypsin-like serine protease [Actinomycetota bacterium]